MVDCNNVYTSSISLQSFKSIVVICLSICWGLFKLGIQVL